jgi:hypothetical protein
MKSRLTIHKNGIKRWELSNGVWHREDGPAIEYHTGTKLWYINGELHREDGPAVMYGSGAKSWHLHGKKYSEDMYKSKVRSMKIKKIL